MNYQLVVFAVLVVVAIVAGVWLWVNGKKKVVLNALGFLVHKAEAYFSVGENQVKIDFVLRRIKDFIHPGLRWLFNEEWVKKQVKIILLKVEKELGYTSTMDDVADKARREVLNYAEDYAKKSITAATDYMTERLLGANVNGDGNLVDNEQIKLVNKELKEKIGLGVNLKAFVQGETDLKGNNVVVGGMSFEKKY